MAATATIIQRIEGLGPERYVAIKLTGDASYPTGGYAITPAMFGFSAFATDGLGSGLPPVAGTYTVAGDLQGNPYSGINPANGNLQLFAATTGVEVAATTNETGTSVLLEAYGH